MRLDRDADGEGAEVCVERHARPPPFDAIKQRALGNVDLEHFFKREPLGAELHLVSAMRFRPSAFVFNRERSPPPVELVEFHDIRDPRNSEPKRPDGHGRHRSDSAAYLGRNLIGFSVQDVALRREAVFGPDLLDMN